MKSKHRIAISALFTILSPVLLMGAMLKVGALETDSFKTSVVHLDRWFLSNYHEAAPKIKVMEVKKEEPVVTCDYEKPEEKIYDAKLIKVRKNLRILPNETFETKIYLENTGNVPWFSDDAACTENMRLGTVGETDRVSAFYSPSFVDDEYEIHPSGWISKNRIKMETLKVEPGEIGEFVFISRAPNPEDVYLEHFAPVVEGKAWIENSRILVPVHVGEIKEDPETLELKLLYIKESGPASEIDFSGGKNLEIDISDQKMLAKFGDYVIYEQTISSGEPGKHPTPRGLYEVLFKQQVRIGGAYPHYIMPKWQAFRWDGYGLHGLPSLGSESVRANIRQYGPDEEVPIEIYNNDDMWTEAVDHLGIPVSHGCVRMGPEGAAFIYDFTEDGTPIVIHD
jgi:hypothetical protein